MPLSVPRTSPWTRSYQPTHSTQTARFTPIIIDDNLEFELEEILDSKLAGKNLKYFVCRVGYNELPWEPAELLKNSP